MKVGFLFLLAALALLSGTHGLTCQDAMAAIVVKGFKVVDRNGDNYISFREEAAIVHDIDPDDDGVITEEEFLNTVSEHFPDNAVLTPQLMREMDTNKDNTLTAMELICFLGGLDTDGSGRVTLGEYRGFWTQLLTRLFQEAGETPMNCSTW